jgi:hypothetical protein
LFGHLDSRLKTAGMTMRRFAALSMGRFAGHPF